MNDSENTTAAITPVLSTDGLGGDLGAEAMIDKLQDRSIELTGLAEVLCSQMQETVGCGDFNDAQKLAWAYDCLSTLAFNLARELSDIAP